MGDKPVDFKTKDRVHCMVHTAIKNGIITRRPCRICGNPKSHGHHEDYSKPYKIDWLCSKHHRIRHYDLIREALKGKNWMVSVYTIGEWAATKYFEKIADADAFIATVDRTLCWTSGPSDVSNKTRLRAEFDNLQPCHFRR